MSKDTLPMISLRPQKKTLQRPKSTTLESRESTNASMLPERALRMLPDGRTLDVQGGNAHDDASVLYVRAPNTLQIESKIEGIAPPIAVHPTKPLLLCYRKDGWSRPVIGASQTWHGGDVRLINFETKEEKERYPLQAPFVWLDEESFLSCSMGFYYGKRSIDPYFNDRQTQIRDLFTDELADGVAKVSSKTNLGELLVRCGVYQRWSRLKFFAERDGILYYGGFLEFGAVRFSDWSVLWANSRHDGLGLGYLLYQMELSPDGEHLAVAASYKGGTHDLVIFSSKDGSKVLGLSLSSMLAESGLMKSKITEVSCIAWHSSGWLAVGTRAGLIAHVSLSGGMRVYRGDARGIDALTFTRDGASLVVASRSPGIKIFPLLEEEVHPSQ
jgi:WD40 repeat protein